MTYSKTISKKKKNFKKSGFVKSICTLTFSNKILFKFLIYLKRHKNSRKNLIIFLTSSFPLQTTSNHLVHHHGHSVMVCSLENTEIPLTHVCMPISIPCELMWQIGIGHWINHRQLSVEVSGSEIKTTTDKPVRPPPSTHVTCNSVWAPTSLFALN